MKTAERIRPDWGVPGRGRDRGPTIFLAGIGAVAAGIGVAGALAGGPIVGVAIAIVLLGSLGLWISGQGAIAFGATKARPVPTGDEPRLENIVAGIASDLGVATPDIFLIERGGPNALAVPGRRPRLAVTKSLAQTFARTEVEAVVAHCLSRLVSGDAARDALAIGAFGIGALRVGEVEDARAAALTRYPPALVSALKKAEPRVGRSARLWFVGDDRSHESPDVRAGRLQDL